MKLILFLLLTSQAWGQDTTKLSNVLTFKPYPTAVVIRGNKGEVWARRERGKPWVFYNPDSTIAALERTYPLGDTLAVYVIFQPFPGSAITAKDAYLINGQLWYRSVAALNKGKWLPFRKGWRVIEIKQSK